MALLTVFTPTYNRAHTLIRTYQSLKESNCKDFIWLIIDDGSTDGTDKLVESWKNENSGFEIQYIYKQNGGMHTAHNVAYENIHTELNMCIDSDDIITEQAVSLIKEKWLIVQNNRDTIAGIIGLDADFEGKILGKPFPSGMKETSLSAYYAGGGTGDKKLVYRTDIIRMYPPYPSFDGEKYVALAYKYRLIDQDYKLAVLNEVLCKVEYQLDGSSKNMYYQYIRNPKGFAFWRKICMKYPEKRSRLFLDCVHYVSSSIILRNSHFIEESPKKTMTVFAIPFGIALAGWIRLKTRASK